MDGFSDYPFRLISRQHGSAMSYTEFINALDVLNGHPGINNKLFYDQRERPVVYQLFDDDPERLFKVALILSEHQPDIIDINMGCPSRQVSSRGAGAGLLREPKIIADIFNRLSYNLEIPVTGKIRLGWDNSSKNYLEVAHIIEDNGGQLVAIHARTKEQAYGGTADWDAIAEVKNVLSIPVIGNGDVCIVHDIEKMKSYTGCDGVMIGRGALGNPWIFSRRERNQIPSIVVKNTMLSHLELMIEIYGHQRGLINFRKHTVHYLSPLNVPKVSRLSLLTTDSLNEFTSILDAIFETVASI